TIKNSRSHLSNNSHTLSYYSRTSRKCLSKFLKCMVDVHWPWNELVREVLISVLINVNLEEVSGFAINWEMKYIDIPAGKGENVCFGIKDCLNYYRSRALPLRLLYLPFTDEKTLSLITVAYCFLNPIQLHGFLLPAVAGSEGISSATIPDSTNSKVKKS
uniref:Uncharacterized protein n=1 Tax=Romanomermis culicivorax TaxID=13658 RepID=A0A915KD21_ROMCU